LYAYFHLAKTFADSSIATKPFGINIVTSDAVWSFAAFLPLISKLRPATPVAVCIDCQILVGMIGASAVNLAHEALADEQIIAAGATGTVEITCDRPDLIRGLIIRNLNTAGRSEAHVRDISVRPKAQHTQ